MQSINSIAIHC